MLINLFDGLMLQLMIVVVTVDASDSLQSVMTELSIILVVLPLIVFCAATIIMKGLHWRRHHYTPVNDDDQTR